MVSPMGRSVRASHTASAPARAARFLASERVGSGEVMVGQRASVSWRKPA